VHVTTVYAITVVGTGSGSGHVQRKSFRLLRAVVAAAEAADDGEYVAIEEAEGGGQHPAEVGDCEQCERNSDDGVEHRDDHSCPSLRRYVPVSYITIAPSHTVITWVRVFSVNATRCVDQMFFLYVVLLLLTRLLRGLSSIIRVPAQLAY